MTMVAGLSPQSKIVALKRIFSAMDRNAMPKVEVEPSAYRVVMVLPKEAFTTLEWMKLELDASSFAEVVRRAVSAYQALINTGAEVLFPPEEIQLKGRKGQRSERVQVILSERTMTKIKSICEVTETTQSECLRESLAVLEHLLKSRSAKQKMVDNETWAAMHM